MVDANGPEDLIIEALPRERAETYGFFKQQPPHAVVLHKDPVNGFGYVVGVLKDVFRYRTPKAYWLTLKTQCAGRSAVWTGTLELAELKAEQVEARGPDPDRISDGARPLRVSVEPLRRG
jgi:ATP-dependent Clp protease adaptor protein ClpS